MTEHGDEGAMGLVLNRAAETTVGEAVPDLAWLAGDDIVHVGGPVAPAVGGRARRVRGARRSRRCSSTTTSASSRPRSRTPTRWPAACAAARVFAGHAGWGPGQLEAEMEEESWIVEPAVREDVFTDDPEELWSRVLRRKGREYALLSTMPVDPSLN